MRQCVLDRCKLPVDITDFDSVKLVCAIFLPETFRYYNQGPGPHHCWELFTINAKTVANWRYMNSKIAFMSYDGVGR